MLESGVSKEALREAAIAKFEALAETSTHEQIRQAANYIVVNVSKRTSKDALHEFKKQLSKLLGTVQHEQDHTYFENAFIELMWALPDSLVVIAAPSELLAHSGILFSSSSMSTPFNKVDEEDSDLDLDEAAPLLGQEKAAAKRRGGRFGKKW